MPVYELLGSKGSKAVPSYTGAIYFEDLIPKEKRRGINAILEACKQDYDTGYRAFKLKIGRGFQCMPKAVGLRRDIEVTHAVREKFPQCALLVDANDSYTVSEMCDYVKSVADCNLYWIEEPFEEEKDNLKKLREAMAKVNCKALIADGEGRKDKADPPTAYGGYMKEFVERLYALGAEKLIDVLVMDLDIVGFSRWRRVMPDLVNAGLRASPHTWMWIPRPYYAAQLAAGVGNISIIEGIPGTTNGINYSAYKFKDGRLIMPDTPGFGLKLRG